MSETVTPQAQGTEQQEQQAQPQVVPAGQEQRAEIIKKYENLYGQQPQQEQQQQVVQPVVQQPVEPVIQQPDQTAILQQLATELAAVKQQLAAQPQQQQVTVSTATQEDADWLAKLAAGDKSEGERLLAQRVKALIGENLQSNAVQQAVALVTAQNQVNEFILDVRSKNADVMPMEQYITVAAAQRIQAAQETGKIKSPADYVTVYKEAVNAEIENARKLILSLRGEGRSQATTRQAEVVAVPAIQPQAVDTQRGVQQQQQQQPAVETVEDYMAKRQQAQARMRGMATA